MLFAVKRTTRDKGSVIIVWRKKITMLTIKEAAKLVDGLTEYRVRQMCIHKQIPCIMAGKKYLINKDILLRYLCSECN